MAYPCEELMLEPSKQFLSKQVFSLSDRLLPHCSTQGSCLVNRLCKAVHGHDALRQGLQQLVFILQAWGLAKSCSVESFSGLTGTAQ